MLGKNDLDWVRNELRGNGNKKVFVYCSAFEITKKAFCDCFICGLILEIFGLKHASCLLSCIHS